jgi:hypothetical protein
MKKAALPGLSFSAENGDNLLLQNSGWLSRLHGVIPNISQYLLNYDCIIPAFAELWLYYPSICWTMFVLSQHLLNYDCIIPAFAGRTKVFTKKRKITGIWVNIWTHDILNINEVPIIMLQHLVQDCDILL